jgi:hypothetical protein
VASVYAKRTHTLWKDHIYSDTGAKLSEMLFSVAQRVVLETAPEVADYITRIRRVTYPEAYYTHPSCGVRVLQDSDFSDDAVSLPQILQQQQQPMPMPVPRQRQGQAGGDDAYDSDDEAELHARLLEGRGGMSELLEAARVALGLPQSQDMQAMLAEALSAAGGDARTMMAMLTGARMDGLRSDDEEEEEDEREREGEMEEDMDAWVEDDEDDDE